jgi:transposase InsO family protein
MSMARLVVTAVLVEGRSKSAVAREFGVSRRWVITLVQRFVAEGEAGLVGRSRRPKRSPARISHDVEEEILTIRKHLDELGHDNGAETIAFHLERRHGRAPSPSTIWRVLRRRGFVTPQPHKRPKSSYVRFEADQPNERWQLDVTHWTLDDGQGVEILNLIDDHSRLCVGSDVRTTFKSGDVVACFNQAADAYGCPAGMLSDNAAVFTGTPRGGGRVALELELIDRGVVFRHSRPYHPQTCGKVERFHQTLKKWLAQQPPAKTRRALQRQLDAFRRYYNDERPHRALHRRTPAEAFAARPKATPLPTRLDDPHFRIRRDRVHESGNITLRHNSKLHHIAVGRRNRGRRILILVQDLDVRILTEDGELLRALTLDPTRDYQPLTKS